MELSEIPKDVAEFVAQHIDSVVRLEVLLVLQSRPQSKMSADDISHELRIDPAWTRAALTALEGAGALERADSGYRYAPRTPDLGQTIASLAQLYSQRRVSIISLIFARPIDPIRQFSDAFRFKKDEKGRE